MSLQLCNQRDFTTGYSDEQIISIFLATRYHSQYTRRNYSRAIYLFRQFIAFKPLREVTWQEVELYKIALEKGFCNKIEKPLAPATINSLIAPLRSLYKWGSTPNIGVFSQNPTTCVHTPKIQINSKNHYLTQREVILFLNQLKKQGYRDYLIGATLVLLGLRVSELVSIRWNHFHSDPLETSIWLTVINGKGGKQREVKVPRALWNLYNELLFHSKQQETCHDLNDRLFPLTVRQVERIIQKAREQSNIKKKVSPHWLRHTSATLALIHGASLQQVQETLGHAQINTTQRYLHTVEQMKKAAPDFIEDCLKEVF
ncbi:tyrosine-type recombinase/integrase [Effusibacillus consociatus]|uniref:Tyrosine-type recombinase/integrase n=1 Tax=Effusibacillus consociatus TaxID=1117041 RepID=A0ABV9Q0H3_9BACL